ncbi:MAG: flagellar hook assembly protein FlgD [Nitrosomonadales bacterium]|nr:flagellar hook assembly protein FlgD [Nitrosomonadales bacterium]
MVTATQDSGSAASVYAALNASSSSAGKNSSVTSTANTQDRFLKLLVTQMKNQDPLNPMDNAQVTSQMAQLSTVTGIDKLNAALAALNSSMSLGQATSASSMIGRGALVAGTSLHLSGGQAIGGLELTQPADSLTVTIKDSTGAVVQTMNLGAQSVGVLPLAWDGKTDTGATAADGAYSISAQAVLSGNKSAVTTLSYGTVNAVTPGTTGATLNVGQLGNFALSAIKQVL